MKCPNDNRKMIVMIPDFGLSYYRCPECGLREDLKFIKEAKQRWRMEKKAREIREAEEGNKNETGH